jgi:class 3 adenylate cyclase
MEAANSSRGASTAGMHAFLFADLRGYTQFAATRGDRAAAELLDRYRTLVREQVARHAGAEVRTEGDSFYILFTSVSEAVQCALAIAAAARQASLDDPALPMNVGIGVHFGETVDTAEGSVGSAVNLASRLASAAGPNEVLVSEVVRSLTGTATDVRTTSVGRRRLKGFAQPLEVFRASTVGSARAPRRTAPLRLAQLAAPPAALLVIVLAGAVLVLSRPAEGPGANPTGSPVATPTPTATAVRFSLGPLPAGTLVERRFTPNIQLDLDQGWCGGTTVPSPDSLSVFTPGTASGGVFEQQQQACAAGLSDPDAGFVDFHRVEQIYGPTACADGSTVSVGRSWNTVTDYLTSIPGTSVTNRVSDTLGGALGVSFDLHVDDASTCLQSGAPEAAILFFPGTRPATLFGTQMVVRPVWWPKDGYLHMWVVDVAGDVVVVILGHEETAYAERRRFASQMPPSQDFLTKA